MNSVSMEHITKEINQIHHMLARETRRGRGLGEHELQKTMEVLVYTRVMYHLPYVTVSRLQNNKLETLLGKCTRLALGVQRLTPIHFLRQTGLLNPLQDRVALHYHVQQQRPRASAQTTDPRPSKPQLVHTPAHPADSPALRLSTPCVGSSYPAQYVPGEPPAPS